MFQHNKGSPVLYTSKLLSMLLYIGSAVLVVILTRESTASKQFKSDLCLVC